MIIQKFEKSEPKKHLVTIDNRKPKEGQEMRAVLYVEAGDMPTQAFSELVKRVSEAYKGQDKDVHYILPVRHGKIGAEIFFESEWLDVVKKTCTINENGDIVLKDGAKDVLVRREYIQ